MTLAEKVGQMTQAERGAVDSDHGRHRRLRPRLAALRRRLGADAQHAEAWADMIDGFQTRGAGDAACRSR